MGQSQSGSGSGSQRLRAGRNGMPSPVGFVLPHLLPLLFPSCLRAFGAGEAFLCLKQLENGCKGMNPALWCRPAQPSPALS